MNENDIENDPEYLYDQEIDRQIYEWRLKNASLRQQGELNLTTKEKEK